MITSSYQRVPSDGRPLLRSLARTLHNFLSLRHAHIPNKPSPIIEHRLPASRASREPHLSQPPARVTQLPDSARCDIPNKPSPIIEHRRSRDQPKRQFHEKRAALLQPPSKSHGQSPWTCRGLHEVSRAGRPSQETTKTILFPRSKWPNSSAELVAPLRRDRSPFPD